MAMLKPEYKKQLAERMEKRILPFLEGEELPEGYFDPPDPYRSPPPSNFNLRELSSYMRQNNKTIYDMTKDEVNRFKI